MSLRFLAGSPYGLVECCKVINLVVDEVQYVFVCGQFFMSPPL